MRRLSFVLLGCLTLIFALAMPAHAGQRFTFDKTATGEGIPGKARGYGGFTWIDSNTIRNIDLRIRDICPEDRDGVYVRLQVYADQAVGKDRIFNAFRIQNNDGCGSLRRADDLKWDSGDFNTRPFNLSLRKFFRARIQVCVDESFDGDECRYTRWSDNPYNNDPTRARG